MALHLTCVSEVVVFCDVWPSFVCNKHLPPPPPHLDPTCGYLDPAITPPPPPPLAPIPLCGHLLFLFFIFSFIFNLCSLILLLRSSFHIIRTAILQSHFVHYVEVVIDGTFVTATNNDTAFSQDFLSLAVSYQCLSTIGLSKKSRL